MYRYFVFTLNMQRDMPMCSQHRLLWRNKKNINLGPVVQNITKLLANVKLISILKYGKYIDIFC